MRRITTVLCFLIFLAGALVGTSAGQQTGKASAPVAMDRGPLAPRERHTPISVTMTLSLSKSDEAEKLLQAIYTPGAPEYHQFLTAEQFAARFGPSDADVAGVIVALAKYRLSAQRTTATTLKVTGMPADLERAFSVSLHSYEVAARDNQPGYRFRAPTSHPSIPGEISKTAKGVIGLDNRPVAHPLHKTNPLYKTNPSTVRPASTGASRSRRRDRAASCAVRSRSTRPRRRASRARTGAFARCGAGSCGSARTSTCRPRAGS